MNEELKVIGLLPWTDNGKKDKVGGLGGFFKDGYRWKDYIDTRPEEHKPYYEALRKFIVENKIRITGQEQDNLAITFNDDERASFSWRGWGDFMAAVWSEEENKDYHYMNFYM